MRARPHLVINLPRRMHLLRACPLARTEARVLLRAGVSLPAEACLMILELDAAPAADGHRLVDAREGQLALLAAMAQIDFGGWTDYVLPISCFLAHKFWLLFIDS